METISVCKQCRREGLKLFLKGDRCFGDKCSIERRTYAPGQHGQRRKKLSEYGVQLREKQKVKRLYGIRERQFEKTFQEAERRRGITGHILLTLLEQRLDNMVYRMGFARSRSEAGQTVKHGHFLVNGKPVDIPSYSVEKGDTVSLKEKSKKRTIFVESVEGAERRGLSPWLKLDKEKMCAEVLALPTRDQLTLPIEEQLIVELYSK